MARPRKPINLQQVEALATIGATDDEIATVLGISTDTVGRRKKDDPEFKESLKIGRDKGKITLRRLQWKSAQGGNVVMLIFLGKQLLGQKSDRQLTGIVDNREDIEPYEIFVQKHGHK